MDKEVDISKVRYVMYIRKSTDDPIRQVRSIEDQITECRKHAERFELNIIGPPIIEKQSAKKPHSRPLFTKMLQDIRNGQYDGILAWNPDRLARNMLEGGEIIDMIDDKIITDLKFVTHHFTRDANGKMLLGMAFVLSKQYSDNLSQNVLRGNTNKMDEGRTHIPKHGYFLDDEDFYRKDEKSFPIIRNIWVMRMKGDSLEHIHRHLTEINYFRKTKTGKEYSLKKQRLSEFFRDPFYYGILISGNNKVDLRTKYDFQPMITEEEYLSVQELSNKRIQPLNTHRKTFYPFRLLAHCAICKGNMVVGPSTGSSGIRYLSFRCDNKLCQRKKRSIRVNVFLDFMSQLLKNGLGFTGEEYLMYCNSYSKILKVKRTHQEIILHSKKATYQSNEKKIDDIALKVINYVKESKIRQVNERMIDELVLQNDELKKEIEHLQSTMPQVDENKLSVEDFLNFSNNASEYLKFGNQYVKDKIVRIILLNFILDEEKVLSYQLKEPFATLQKKRDGNLSRGGQT